MTWRAEELLERTMDFPLRPRKDDRQKLIAFILHEAADRLCTDWAEMQHPADVLHEIADEVENLK